MLPQAGEGHGPIGFVAGIFSMGFRPPDDSPARHDRGKVVWVVRKYGSQCGSSSGRS